MAGMLNQPMQSQATTQVMPQVAPQTLPNFPIQAMPFNMGQGYGAARFLTGNAMIPLNFNAPVTQFTPFQFQPGDFSKFASAQQAESQNPFASAFFPIIRAKSSSE